jgi:hypothetical protein
MRTSGKEQVTTDVCVYIIPKIFARILLGIEPCSTGNLPLNSIMRITGFLDFFHRPVF